MATKTAQGSKNKQATALKEAEVLASVEGLNLDTVSGTLADTQVEVQKSLAGLSAKLTEKLQLLENIQKAIDLKQDELKELYNIEAKVTELDELEAEIESRRKTWEEEQAAKKREFAEQQSERNKQWARSEEEYQYRLAQEHKKHKDAFDALMGQSERDNRDRQEKLEKEWAEREGELKKRETELADLREKVANMSEVIKKEVNAAVAIATNSVKKEYETKMQLANKDSETAQKLADQTVASLQTSLAKQQAQVDDLKTQLEQAHRDVKEISAKALDSASGRATTDALQRIMEKEQGSGKQTK